MPILPLQEFVARAEREVPRWAKIVREAHVKME